jgi:hypothetical protein
VTCGCTATISGSDERAPLWRFVFGDLTFPIRPVWMAMEGFPGKRFLQGDVEALTDRQRSNLIEAMASKFRIPPAEVADSLRDGVFPILDEHVTISFCRLHSRLLRT